MTLLRTYQHIARDYHLCDHCFNQICPGDAYEGAVFLNDDRKEHRIMVLKEHIHPPCPEDDPFKEDRDEHHGALKLELIVNNIEDLRE